MNSATKVFNQNQYFQNINFKLEPMNEYQARLIGNFKR